MGIYGHIQLNRVWLTIIAMKLELGNLSEMAPAPVVFVLLASLLVATTAIVGCIIGVVAFCFRLCILVDHLHLGYLSRRRRRREAEKRVYDGWLDVWLGSYRRASMLEDGEYANGDMIVKVIETNAYSGL